MHPVTLLNNRSVMNNGKFVYHMFIGDMTVFACVIMHDVAHRYLAPYLPGARSIYLTSRLDIYDVIMFQR